MVRARSSTASLLSTIALSWSFTFSGSLASSTSTSMPRLRSEWLILHAPTLASSSQPLPPLTLQRTGSTGRGCFLSPPPPKSLLEAPFFLPLPFLPLPPRAEGDPASSPSDAAEEIRLKVGCPLRLVAPRPPRPSTMLGMEVFIPTSSLWTSWPSASSLAALYACSSSISSSAPPPLAIASSARRERTLESLRRNILERSLGLPWLACASTIISSSFRRSSLARSSLRASRLASCRSTNSMLSWLVRASSRLTRPLSSFDSARSSLSCSRAASSCALRVRISAPSFVTIPAP
mmetsp:Transcript_47098/g.150964  ORF Transcript_47098/g.150964 Transcript_47098/m.150964 type:complete len:292 (-) Transcript_47098:227-1102(-)